MDPISATIATTLIAKCSIAFLAETALGGWIANRGDNIITNEIPKLSKRLLAQFKDTEKPVNHHLQKAILSSHWLATKVFAEQLSKTNNSPVFKRIISIADEQINLLKKEDYQLKTVSPDAYETDSLIFKDHESRVTEKLRDKVIEYHTIILFDLLQNFKHDNPECILFKDALKNGLPSDSIDWFQLACSFLNELLKGDNNKAKDAFQNQELAKIAFGIDGLKQDLMTGFEQLANKYVQGIGEDRFNGFMNWLGEDLKDIKGTLIEIKNVVISTHKDILEIKGLLKRELNLNNFPDYKTLLYEIEELNTAFKDKRAEEQETLDFLQNESDERKRNRFEKDLSTITQALLTIDNARTTKENEFNEFRNNIEKTWLSLYAGNTPNSPRLLKARELFEMGDLQGANAVLDPQDLQQDFDLLKKAKDFIQQKEEILAKEYIAKANFTVLEKSNENWFEEAKEYYHKALELHENYDNCFALAYFLQEHNQIVEAIVLYEKTLLFSSNIIEKATILNNLGSLQRAKNDFDNASASCQEALDIYRELVRVNPQTYLPHVAMTLNNLAILQRVQNDFENASASYQEALDIRRELVRVNPQTHLPDLANTLNNLGTLQRAKNDFENASESHQEALKIRRELARVNPQTYLPDVAMTLNNLGLLQYDKNDFENASASYQEALDIYRELARVNPQTYLPNLATTLNNLGLLQHAKNDFENVSANYQEALGIYRELARVHPQTYLPYVAITLNNLGLLQRAKNDFENASAGFQEALNIYIELAWVNPQTYLPNVAMTLSSLAVLQSDKDDFEKASESFQEALDIRRELARQNPDAYQIDLAETLINFAIFHLSSVKDKDKSLDLAYHAFINAAPYYQQVPKASKVCKMVVQVWQAWGEDLQKYFTENQPKE